MAKLWPGPPARASVRYIRVVYLEHPARASRDFHNLILSDTDWAHRLGSLLALFADPPPAGVGVHNHHDVTTW